MTRYMDPLTLGTAGASVGGLVLAQATGSPGMTAGTIVLALIGLASIAIRGHYESRRLELELRIAHRLGSCSGTCPFSTDGRPACVPHTMTAAGLATPHPSGVGPHSEGS